MTLSQIQGAIEGLTVTEHKVNILIKLVGISGCQEIDYRTSRAVLASVGRRSVIYFTEPPVADLVTATDGNVSYNIRMVHHDRNNDTLPTTAGSVASQLGASEIVRSQFLNTNSVSIGSAANVTELVKPDPLVGYSPRLVLFWTSLGTTAQSSVEIVIRCSFSASGSDLQDFV